MRLILQGIALLAVVMLSSVAFGTAPSAEHFALLPLLAAIGGKRIAKWSAGAIGRTIRGAARNVGRTVIRNRGTIGVGIGGMLAPGVNPFAAPQGTPGGGPAPLEGPIGRTISRALPGGLSGREFTPFEGTEIDGKTGWPIAVHPAKGERYVAPRGYVIVYPWGRGEEPIAMLKRAAIALNLWTSEPKPPISGYDARAIRRAASATKRVKKLAQKVGFSCVKKGRGKC